MGDDVGSAVNRVTIRDVTGPGLDIVSVVLLTGPFVIPMGLGIS